MLWFAHLVPRSPLPCTARQVLVTRVTSETRRDLVPLTRVQLTSALYRPAGTGDPGDLRDAP